MLGTEICTSTSPSPEGSGLEFLSGKGLVIEQDVSVGLVQAAICLDVIFGWRVGGRRGLLCPVS